MHPQTKFLLATALSLPLAATAQSVITPRPSMPVVAPYLQDLQADTSPFAGSADSVFATLLGLQPMQLGPVAVRPHAVYRVFYSDGIQYQPGHPISTVVNEISPGVLFNIGTHWAVDYTPGWTFYSNEHLRNTLDHSLRLNGGFDYRDWLFTLNHSYQISSTSLTETAQQTDQEVHSTTLNVAHPINSVLSIDLNAAQNIRFANGFSSAYSWSTMDWLNYYLGHHFDIGVGAGFGYDNIPDGVDMSSEQLQGRFGWQLTDKTSLQVSGGAEDRQFVGSAVSAQITPVFGAALNYRPFQYTGLALSANRSITPSLFQDEANENTSVSVSLNQRLLGHFNANVTGSYNHAQYIAAAQGIIAGRHDNYYSISTRLSWVLLKQFSMSLFYSYSDNSSSLNVFGYSSSQAGFQMGYRL